MICFLLASFYLITGTASVGKTSIINELKNKGEVTISETATEVIQSLLESGQTDFMNNPDFECTVVKRQIEKEEPFLNVPGRVFLDRGLFDGYAYVHMLNLVGTPSLKKYNQIIEGIDLKTRYKAVFMVLPYEEHFSPTHTEIRHEDLRETLELQTALFAIYAPHPKLFLVPGQMSPKSRAEFILNKIHELESN